MPLGTGFHHASYVPSHRYLQLLGFWGSMGNRSVLVSVESIDLMRQKLLGSETCRHAVMKPYFPLAALRDTKASIFPGVQDSVMDDCGRGTPGSLSQVSLDCAAKQGAATHPSFSRSSSPWLVFPPSMPD